MKKYKGVVLGFLLGAAFGRAVFREAGELMNVAVFGRRNV